MDKFTVGVNPSVSIAWLLDGSGSVIPGGMTTEAELIKEPVAVGRIVALIEKLAAPEGARLMRVSMLPRPFGDWHAEPDEAVQFQVTFCNMGGNASST